MKNKFLAAALLAAPVASIAATVQGQVGVTSTGTVDVILEVPKLVSITGLNEINLGTYSGTGAVSGTSDVCVRTNSGDYEIYATTNRGSYVLSDGTETIGFSVNYGGTNLDYGSANKLSNQPADQTQLDVACSGSEANKLSVSIDEAAMQAVGAGSYSATMTLVVSPL